MYSVTLTGSGRTFEASADETILDAATRQGVTLGYSCRTGRCSSCKGRVVSGSSVARQEELGLNAEERAQGFILTCVRQALGPMSLDIEEMGHVVLPEARTVPCRIQSIEKCSSDVVRVVLRLPPASRLDFLPGQYVDVIGPEGLRRSYSIANAPRLDNQIELHIREVPDGAMSRYWFHQAKQNDLLRLRGPLGTFFLRDLCGKHLVLLATGTGIAPVKAMLEGLVQESSRDQPESVTVYWGGRRLEDLYWHPPEWAGLRFVPVLSRGGEGWNGAQGYVQDVLMADQPDWANMCVYACGSDSMIHAAQALLRAEGLPERNFHSDAFVCSA